MPTRMPGVRQVTPLNTSPGTFVAGYAVKLVLHTTEGGGNFSGADAYHGTQSYPHFEVEAGKGITQFFPIDRSARALYNAAGGVETNNGWAIQIEIAGSAAKIGSISDEVLGYLAQIALFVHEQLGMPLVFPLPFRPPFTNGVRLEGSALRDVAGIIGHQHFGEGNDHTDPGQFPVERLAALLGTAAPATPPTPDSEEPPTVFVYDFPLETGVWITNGLTTRPTNDPTLYLNAGAKHLGKLTAGQHNELQDGRHILQAVNASRTEALKIASDVVAGVLKGLSISIDADRVARLVSDELSRRLAS